MIVLDTHCWLWWLSEPKQLSRNATAEIEKAVAEGEALISAISVWEVALLVTRSRLDLSMDVDEWFGRAEAIPGFRFVPVNNRIAVRAVQLPGTFHTDPADRLIVATALIQGTAVATKDDKIRRYPHVRSVW